MDMSLGALFSSMNWSAKTVVVVMLIMLDERCVCRLNAEAGVPCLHYYTMGNAEMTCKIAAKVF